MGSSRLWHIYMYSPGYHKPWYLGFMSWITMLFAICFIELYLFCVCYCFEFVHILPWMVWNTVYKGADRELSMVTLGDNTVISDLNCKFYLFMKIVLPWEMILFQFSNACFSYLNIANISNYNRFISKWNRVWNCCNLDCLQTKIILHYWQDQSPPLSACLWCVV